MHATAATGSLAMQLPPLTSPQSMQPPYLLPLRICCPALIKEEGTGSHLNKQGNTYLAYGRSRYLGAERGFKQQCTLRGEGGAAAAMRKDRPPASGRVCIQAGVWLCMMPPMNKVRCAS